MLPVRISMKTSSTRRTVRSLAASQSRDQVGRRGEDVARPQRVVGQVAQRRHQVVALRGPGVALPAVGPGQLADPVPQPGDVEPVEEAPVDGGGIERAAAPGLRHLDDVPAGVHDRPDRRRLGEVRRDAVLEGAVDRSAIVAPMAPWTTARSPPASSSMPGTERGDRRRRGRAVDAGGAAATARPARPSAAGRGTARTARRARRRIEVVDAVPPAGHPVDVGATTWARVMSATPAPVSSVMRKSNEVPARLTISLVSSVATISRRRRCPPIAPANRSPQDAGEVADELPLHVGIVGEVRAQHDVGVGVLRVRQQHGELGRRQPEAGARPARTAASRSAGTRGPGSAGPRPRASGGSEHGRRPSARPAGGRSRGPASAPGCPRARGRRSRRSSRRAGSLRCFTVRSPAATWASRRILMLTSWSEQSTPAELSMASVLTRTPLSAASTRPRWVSPRLPPSTTIAQRSSVAVDADGVVGPVADLGVGLRRRLDVGADAAVPEQVHGRREDGRQQLVRRHGRLGDARPRTFGPRSDTDGLGRPRPHAASGRDGGPVVVVPAGAGEVEEALPLGERAGRVGVRVEEDVAVVEGRHQPQVRAAQHAVAEHVARHVADADHGQRVVSASRPSAAGVAAGALPRATGGDAHGLVVVAGAASRRERVAQPEAVALGDLVGEVGERGRPLVGRHDEVGVVRSCRTTSGGGTTSPSTTLSVTSRRPATNSR